MARYHINQKGNPGICRAGKQACPFGEDSEHFPTPEAATKAYEARAQREATYYASPRLGMLADIPQANRRALLDFMAEQSTPVLINHGTSWHDSETDHKYFGLNGETRNLRYNFYGWTNYEAARHLIKCEVIIPDNVELIDETFSQFADTLSPADQQVGLTVYGGSDTSPSSINCKCGKHKGLMLRYDGSYYDVITETLRKTNARPEPMPANLRAFLGN